MRKCLLYLGNGFDVAHGSKTRYTDFYENKLEDLHIGAKNGNLLFQHIIDNIKGGYWFDLENGLFKYSKELTKRDKGSTTSAKQFEEEFVELKKLLFDYLQNPLEDRKKSSGYAIKELSDEWQKFDCHVISFNYTHIAAAYTTDSNNHDSGLSFDPKIITYQHGVILNPDPYRLNSYEDIVVGIDESQKVAPLHSFLYKTSQHLSNIHQLMEKVQDATVFIIYGCSMGDSDRFYFKNIFDKRKKNKHYIVYGYGEEEINRLKSTIREYTEGLGEFQDDNHNNEIIIIDSKNATKAIKETKDYVESILSAP